MAGLDVCDLMEVDRRGSLISPAAPVAKQSHFPVEVFLLWLINYNPIRSDNKATVDNRNIGGSGFSCTKHSLLQLLQSSSLSM